MERRTAYRSRTRLLSLSAFFLSLLLAAGLLRAGVASLEVEEPDHDFGQLFQGEEARHTFIVRNTGSAQLEISNVRSSCGCTVPSLGKRSLAPGESTELTAVFDSGRFRGPVTKNIYVYSNDVEHPVTKLSISAEIQVDIEVVPSAIYFAGLEEGEHVERKVSFRNLSGETVTISEIASTVSDVKLDLRKMKVAPGEETELSLTIDKVTKEMKLTGELAIYNTSRQSPVKVRLYGGMIK